MKRAKLATFDIQRNAVREEAEETAPIENGIIRERERHGAIHAENGEQLRLKGHMLIRFRHMATKYGAPLCAKCTALFAVPCQVSYPKG